MEVDRPLELKRFIDYCLSSETIKADGIFESFLNLGDRA